MSEKAGSQFLITGVQIIVPSCQTLYEKLTQTLKHAGSFQHDCKRNS